MTHLTPALLLGQAQAIMGVVAQAIEMVAPGESGVGGGQGGSPDSSSSAARTHSLLASVRASALRALLTLLQHTPATVAPHILALAPHLARLAQFSPSEGCRPFVRATAVDCLGALAARMPHHQLHPIRALVVQGLVPVLDDPNRAVRRRAGACRNAWLV